MLGEIADTTFTIEALHLSFLESAHLLHPMEEKRLVELKITCELKHVAPECSLSAKFDCWVDFDLVCLHYPLHSIPTLLM
jgi:hypothetical protein